MCPCSVDAGRGHRQVGAKGALQPQVKGVLHDKYSGHSPPVAAALLERLLLEIRVAKLQGAQSHT